MSDAPEPQWDLLPHEPEQFFGLDGDFDLRELKRSYNRLIRRFKPEKFPAEFQRIRAAYESLNDALRYHVPTQRLHPPRPKPKSKEPQSTEPTREETTRASPVNEDEAPLETPLETPATNFARNVEDEPPAVVATSPEQSYERLRALEFKSAEAYVRLALLADVVHGRSPIAGESFVDWLLAGLADHHGDWGLAQLLREYLSEDHPLDALVVLLQRSVEVLPADRFQYVTERAWDRLLREAPFDTFRDCLERCGSQLGRAVDHSQLVFYVHILKFAIWKADPEFLNDILATVEDHYHDLDHWAQEEFEIAGLLLDYKQRREQFIALGPCAQRIDQAMEQWCCLSETAGDSAVLDCQYFLNTKGRQLLEELADLSADWSFLLMPWDHIVGDVLDRLDEPEPVDDSTAAVHARDFMIRNVQRRGRTLQSNIGFAQMMVGFAMFLLTLAGAIAFAVRAGFNVFGELRVLAALLDSCFAALTFVVGLIVSLFVFVRGNSATKVVYAVARPDLIKLFRAAPLPAGEMAEVIAAREDEKYGDDDIIRDTDVITEKLASDPGIELFSLAQICLRAADPEPLVEPLIIE